MRKFLFLTLLLVLFSIPGRAQKQEQKDSLVRLLSARSMEQVDRDGQSYRKVIGPARFFHNNTYLLCDTALWNMNTSIIECYSNVSIIQEDTKLTSDKLIYLVDEDLAQFRGSLVQLEDKDGNVLRTRHLDYNTKDSVATFMNGGAMRDKDGQIIESRTGDYDSKTKLFAFVGDVNMFTDSIFIKTTSLDYYSETGKAFFGKETDAWKEDNMLSADAGWYDRQRELFLFRRSVHGMNNTQEAWSDSLYFHRNTREVELLGHAQITDTTRNTFSMGGRMHYVDSSARLTMTRDPVVIGVTEGEKPDTTYARADVMIYYTVPRCAIDTALVLVSAGRLKDINSDAVAEYRRKAAEDAARAAEQAKKNDPNAPPTKGDKMGHAPSDEVGTPGKDGAGSSGKGSGMSGKKDNLGDKPALAEGLNASSDTTRQNTPLDSTGIKMPLDSTGLRNALDSTGLRSSLDSTGLGRLADSTGLGTLADSTGLGTVTDSTALVPPVPEQPKDSTKIGFMRAFGNFRLFKKDLQIVCDSLEYTDLDSLIRLYKRPLIWNDARRQYSSDSLFAVVKGSSLEKASLMADAFVIIQEDSLCFDQIRSVEMMAYFDTTGAIRRFDAMGDANAIFYIQEDSTFATVNFSKSKILSAGFKEGEIDEVHYFDEAKSDAYPVAQITTDQRSLKGFNWNPSVRPASPSDITDKRPRPSQRRLYSSRPRAKFVNTDIYFPGYMESVRQGIEDARLAREQRRRERQEREAFVRDSLALAASLASQDSTAADDAIDSLAVAGQLRDSLHLKDSLTASLAIKDTTAVSDSLATVKDTTAVSDSLATVKDTSVVEKVLTPAELRAQEAERRRAEREARAREREEARAREWARLDSLDNVRAAEKAARKAAKARKKKLKELERLMAQEAEEEAILQEYIEYYRRKKAAEDARKAEEAARKAEEQLNALPDNSQTLHSESNQTEEP